MNNLESVGQTQGVKPANPDHAQAVRTVLLTSMLNAEIREKFLQPNEAKEMLTQFMKIIQSEYPTIAACVASKASTQQSTIILHLETDQGNPSSLWSFVLPGNNTRIICSQGLLIELCTSIHMVPSAIKAEEVSIQELVKICLSLS